MKDNWLNRGWETVAVELKLRAEAQVAEGEPMPMEKTSGDEEYFYYRSPVFKYVAVFEWVRFSDAFLKLPVDARSRVYEWILGGYKDHEVSDPEDQHIIRYITFKDLIQGDVISHKDCWLNNGGVWDA